MLMHTTEPLDLQQRSITQYIYQQIYIGLSQSIYPAVSRAAYNLEKVCIDVLLYKYMYLAVAEYWT